VTTPPPSGFDPTRYKAATREQWNKSGAGYDAWGEALFRLIETPMVDLFDRAGVGPGSRVLELAAGSGRVTLPLAARVGPGGAVLATDLAPEMLAIAEKNARAKGLGNVAFREMDGEAVDVPEGSFDTALSSLGLMFFPHPVRSLEGQRRAVRPGGKVAALVIGTPQKNPFFSVPAKVIRERAQLPAPQPGMPGPFALGAPGAVEAAFEQAGLREVQARSFPATVEMADRAQFLRFLGDAFGALHMMMSGLDDAAKQATWDAVGEALAPFDGPQGFRCPAELIVCVGTCQG